jgi:uncharacterized protein YggU (UPF0235/DUF167 family)
MTLRIRVKAVPGSSRSSMELFGDMIKVRVQAAPEKGKANAAIAELLATKLQLPASAVRITGGHTSPLKTVSIEGLDLEQLRQLIESQA